MESYCFISELLESWTQIFHHILSANARSHNYICSRLASDSRSLEILGLIINTSQFKTSLAQFLATIMQDAQAGGLDFVEIKFKNYTNELIENFGSVSLDSDGNKVYDLMIPRQDLTFENDMNVQECYFHAMNYFDIEIFWLTMEYL